MKRNVTLIVFCLTLALTAFSQNKTYFSSGGEMIFSFASIDDHGSKEGSVLRWSPVFNIQSMVNLDMSQRFGLFSGLAIRNVGFIYDHYTPPSAAKGMQEGSTTFKEKFRTYNLGIPVGFKIGNMNKMFLYAGYEVEFPFHFKEKRFDGGDKIQKTTGWFSNRVEQFQHGFLVGVQFPYGMNLKFKYYLSSFLNQDFVDGSGQKPYEGLDAHVFYFSLCSNLFKNFDYAHPTPSKDKKL
jgi:hypothetical protein